MIFSSREYEESALASYAVKSSISLGRIYPEPEHPYRTPFQRDRDRIVHSSAFRRLEAKTQVFVATVAIGGYYRNRLTHTIEVSQITRTIARYLRVNEDLAEAIALGHDLGHPPFGHIGEHTLNELMTNHGGFEHNIQSLRVVDFLESRYPQFPGLNLSNEVREGLFKHKETTSPENIPHGLDPSVSPTIEAQIVNIADEITYTCHDVDDGVKSGIITEDMLREVPLCAKVLEDMNNEDPITNPRMRRYHLVRKIIDAQVSNLIKATTNNIISQFIASLEDVRSLHTPIVTFTDDMKIANQQLKDFLYEKFYRHPRVLQTSDISADCITFLYKHFLANPGAIPSDTRARSGDVPPQRVVCDYIAGMTDTYARSEYSRVENYTSS